MSQYRIIDEAGNIVNTDTINAVANGVDGVHNVENNRNGYYEKSTD